MTAGRSACTGCTTDTLRLWILGGGAWTVNPDEGNATKLDDEALPVLWAPEGERRIRLVVDGDKTKLNLLDRSGDRTRPQRPLPAA